MILGPRNKDEEVIFAEEEFRVHVQHTIQKLLNDKSLTHAQLATALGVTEARVSQIFSSQCNLTLRMLGRVFYVLGEKAQLSYEGKRTESTLSSTTDRWYKQWEALGEKRPLIGPNCNSANPGVYEEKNAPLMPRSTVKVA